MQMFSAFFFDCLILEMERIDCIETLITNHQSTMRKIQTNAEHIYKAAKDWKHAFYLQGMKHNLNYFIKYAQK